MAHHDLAGLGPERLRHASGDEHAAERLVAARDALRKGDEVGTDAEALAADPVAEPPEAGDHRVDHQQDAVLPADRGDLLDVARRRREDAARAHHRLAEERSHALRPDALELVPQRLGRVVLHLGRRRDERPPAVAHRLHAADRGAERHRAVVAVRAADDVEPLRLVQGLPVETRELRCCVDRVAAAHREEDLGTVHRRHRGELRGQLERRRIRHLAEDRPRLERAQLPRDRVGDLLPPVADVAVPEARGAVEVAVAGVVPDMDAFAAHEDELVAAHRRHVREGMPEARVTHARSLIPVRIQPRGDACSP